MKSADMKWSSSSSSSTFGEVREEEKRLCTPLRYPTCSPFTKERKETEYVCVGFGRVCLGQDETQWRRATTIFLVSKFEQRKKCL